jgi:hypothetical protein
LNQWVLISKGQKLKATMGSRRGMRESVRERQKRWNAKKVKHIKLNQWVLISKGRKFKGTIGSRRERERREAKRESGERV